MERLKSVAGQRQRIGVYPGTFDPITLGHLDIIRRGAKLVDRLIIGVTTNPSKDPLFTPEERIAMVTREVAEQGIENVEVVGFNALLMKFAEKQGASVIIRGLRAVADFEYEYQMAGMNQQLNNRIETVFLMADVSLQPIASKLVKEIAQFGGDISHFVTDKVRDDVVERIEMQGRLGDY
ncbi:coenzyme A biosynthesis protein [Novosphingobium nitrogenifigens DSM 19370]|uniref:Phosphopantetheine adenylyltransferase n=1 Tax=Novosphingobium nitrogenifigens DSM 19370 TaxID=983920 RepID=F1Z8W4_9SPHN|nr:pantetheine-phosphate adenylyltransferase [Novosphingobium nitrogenifigens]EGD58875.1 coenzyme A biosynthesis protein [Novosphingobium nitrogenifigens DSM 19370]